MGIFRRDYKKVDAGVMKQDEALSKLAELGYKPSDFSVLQQQDQTEKPQPIQPQPSERFKYTTQVVEDKDKSEEYFIYELSRIKEEVISIRRQMTYLETRMDILLKYFKE